jgi:hypothetical protein
LGKDERISSILFILEAIKKPMEQLNTEIQHLLHQDVPNENYIITTPEFEKVMNYYLGLPNASHIESIINEIKKLNHTLNHSRFGVQ